MGAMFQIAGGTLSAQDETAAAALKAAAGPAPFVNGPSSIIGGISNIAGFMNSTETEASFDWVNGEDASGMSLETIKTGAEGLSPDSLRSTATRMSTASQTLGDASSTLLASVQQHLGNSWTGEFADTALANVAQFHNSATSLASELGTVADRANALADGYDSTRTQVAQLAAGDEPTDKAEKEAAAKAAREDAQRIIHSDYNPHIEEANLSNLTFTPAHRVGSASGAGTTGVSPVDLWNSDVPAAQGGTAGSRTPNAGVDASTYAATASSGATTPAPAGGSGAAGAAGPNTVAATSGGATGSGASVPLPTPPMTSPSTPTTGGATTGTTGTTTATAPRKGGTSAGTSAQQRGATSVGGSRPANGGGSVPGGSQARGTAIGRGGTGGVGRPGSGMPFGSGSTGIGRVPASSAASGASALGGAGAARGASGTGSLGSGALGASGGGPRLGSLGATGGAPGAVPSSSGPGAGAPGSGTSPGSARSGAPMMGMAPGVAGGRSGDNRHSPAGYLAHPANASELVGTLPGAVHPVLRGGRSLETNSDVRTGEAASTEPRG